MKKVTVVSEETKKELEKMIAQNQELSSLLSKTRNDSSTKVCIDQEDISCKDVSYTTHYAMFRYPL